MKIENWTLKEWRAPAAPDPRRTLPNGRIDLLSCQEDFDCVLMGSFGLSARAIAEYCHLTEGQVYYRLKRANIRLSDFREGRGPYARMVFQYLKKRAATRLTNDLRQIDNAA